MQFLKATGHKIAIAFTIGALDQLTQLAMTVDTQEAIFGLTDIGKS